MPLSEWNPQCAKFWNRFRTRLAQDLGYAFAFFRAVEVQKKTRRALHLHVLIRVDRPLLESTLRRYAIDAGFGHSVDLEPLAPGSRKAANYVSKYATKDADFSQRVPWAVDHADPITGEITRVDVDAPRYRNWSSSRSWGVTMKQLREERARLRSAGVVRLEPSAHETGLEVPVSLRPATADPP